MKKCILLVLLVLMPLMVSAEDLKLKDGVYAKFITSKGEILTKLFSERVPATVANFVGLAEGTKTWVNPITKEAVKGKALYQNLVFHRVIADFMIQGGDPLGTGYGGPGFQFKDEFHKDLKHNKAGVLSMANSGPNTNGSQFFITHGATPWLDGKHAVFGQVIRGIKVVNAIQKGDQMLRIEIIRVGEKAQKFVGK